MDRVIKRVDFPKTRRPQILKVCAYTRVSSGKDAMLHSLSVQVNCYIPYRLALLRRLQ